jgi:hypothetical protein
MQQQIDEKLEQKVELVLQQQNLDSFTETRTARLFI